MPAFLRRNVALPWLLVGLQALCVLFLVSEEASDLFLGGRPAPVLDNDLIENLVLAVLVVSLAASAFQVRRVMGRQKRLESQVRIASGAFAGMLEEHFETWALTPSECDVAMLCLKGFSIAEIAGIRKTADGTVKAQCNAIYRKAGVSGRPQLLSLFIDELLHGGVLEGAASGQSGPGGASGNGRADRPDALSPA